jgi:hypothetical protein
VTLDEWEIALAKVDTTKPFLSNPSGKVWSFSLEIRNLKNESRALGSTFSFELSDDHGALYKDPSRAAGLGTDSPGKVITPRDTLELVLLFDVASDARPQQLSILDSGPIGGKRAAFDMTSVFAYAPPTHAPARPSTDTSGKGEGTPELEPTTGDAALQPASTSITYEGIVQQYQALSNNEWEKYRLSLIGQRVEGWRGWVDVLRKQITTGKWEMKIDLDSPEQQSLSWEVRTIIPATDAPKYKDEQELLFSGSISDVSCIVAHCNVDLADPVFQTP